VRKYACSLTEVAFETPIAFSFTKSLALCKLGRPLMGGQKDVDEGAKETAAAAVAKQRVLR